jgi:spermidine/putrescine transport system permease protein|tara:strand:- start:1143 stop:1934 length:792 start_codon:yes stop_codon:yes gene_type:complete
MELLRKPVTVPLILGFYLFILYAPVLLLPLFSFNDSIYMTFPLKAFTTKWYVEMANDVSLIKATWASVKIALISAFVSTVLGFLAAKAMTQYQMRGKAVLLGFIMLPLIVPSIILGASLLSFFRQFLDVNLSLWTLGIAHILICIPFSMLVLVARLEGFDRNLEEASYDLGMGAWQTFRRVTLPLAMPGVMASLLLSFIVSFDEFLLAFFLSGNQATLPVYMYSLLRFPNSMPAVLAMGSVILVLSVVIIAIAEWLRRGKVKT